MNEIQPKHIVCIGGGTGTFVVLKGLKNSSHRITAIVSMSDSGGSNKRIRDEFGLLPTSDIRQCLVALSDENGGAGIVRKLFMYRFEKGEGISGMTFGNLFMAALSDILGSQAEAFRQTSKILRVHGSVLPVSFTKTNLVASYKNGTTLHEEHFIDEPDHDGTIPIQDIWLEPQAESNPEAIHAIHKANLIVLGPGDLYTSVIPNLLVHGISEALSKTKAKIVYVMNLMTKYGQTYNFTAQDHLHALEKIIGPNIIDTVIINTVHLPEEALKLYAKYQEYPVVNNLQSTETLQVIEAPVAGSKIIEKSTTDSLVRSLIRHDSELLAKVLLSIVE